MRNAGDGWIPRIFRVLGAYRIDLPAIVFLIIVPLAYFWQITLGQGVWFGNDIARTYYPLGVELSRALNEGRLPLWTLGMYGGFPILADAQIGALYPVNMLLFRFLSPQFALAYSMLLHFAWGAVGMYLFARACGLRPASAMLAGLVFSFNGFMFSRLEHATVLTTSTWLPWPLFFFQCLRNARAQNKPVGVWLGLTVLALGIQFLCGFPQVSFMNALTFLLYAFFGIFWDSKFKPRAPTARSILKIVLLVGLIGVLALGVVAMQLIPTAELVGYSVRTGKADYEFATSYSLPAEFLVQFVYPFLYGEPSEGANNEYWGYFGIIPFAFAALAIFLRRNRRSLFWAVFAVFALLLALGDATPLYNIIYRLPGFSFFRVPARYLVLFVFACAFLSGIAFDELAERLGRTVTRWIRVLPFGAMALALVTLSIWLAENENLSFWLALWKYLPFALALLALVLLWFVYARKIDRTIFQTIVLGIVIVDLTSLAPPFVKTLGQVTDPAYVETVPRSLSILSDQLGVERVLTDLSLFPSLPSIRNSLYPNMAVLYGKESATAYSSLASAGHSRYLNHILPKMLNLANVRYYMVPLEPRYRTQSAIPPDNLFLDVLNNEEQLPATPATAIVLSSFTEQAENLDDGTLVGELIVRYSDGHIATFPLRVGVETADWDAERKNPKHRPATIAHAFPAYWRSFGRMFQGRTYISRFIFSEAAVVGVKIAVTHPSARLTVESVLLYNGKSAPQSLAKLVNKNDFDIAYFSDTVVAWENHDVLPRAFIAHAAEIVDGETAFQRLHEPNFSVERLLLLEEGQPMSSDRPARDAVEIVEYKSERVVLTATTDQPGYLFISDSWYPGWQARVDDKPAPIYRADYIFRAVPLAPGTHQVVFEYHPDSLTWGASISLASLVLLVGAAWWGNKYTRFFID